MNLWRRLRAFWARGAAPSPSGTEVARRDRDGADAERTVVVAEVPLPLAEMYADLLRAHGLPAMLRSGGAGRGALGGAPVMVQVLVRAEVAAQAQEVLGVSDDEQSDDYNGDMRKDGESR